MTSSTSAGPTARLALPDAFRGIAAMAVVVYHLYHQNLAPAAVTPLPEPFHSLFTHGYLGVYVFFVLSGFVIALSIRGAWITPAFIGRFALRRSLRLDPPYWAVIAIAVVISVVAHREQAPPPSAGSVVAHVFYAQTFAGYPQIIGVLWTLCLEIQFYLVFVVVLMLAQRLVPRQAWLAFLPLAVVSVIASAGWIDLGIALFVWAWPFFFLGVITAWHLDGRMPTAGWACVALGSCVIAVGHPDRIAAAMVTTFVLFVAGRRTPAGRLPLQEVTLGRALQYLGKISYSLYLTHLLIATKACRVAIRALGGGPLSWPKLLVILVGCVGLSVVVAHVFYLCVERPAQRLSKRITLAARRST
ncbi:MAG: acyltransferase [Kofleriaceae bacterium]